MFGAMDSAPNAATSVPAVKVRWQWSRFPELAAAELYAALAARQQVFTVEQHCAFQDADGYDLDAWHLFAWAADPLHPERGATRALGRALQRSFSQATCGCSIRAANLPNHRSAAC